MPNPLRSLPFLVTIALVATWPTVGTPAAGVEHKFTGLDTVQFGYSVAVDEDGQEVWVGEPYHDDPTRADTGKAWRYRKSGGSWSSSTSFERPVNDREIGDRFGHAVAVDGGLAAIAIPYADMFQLPTSVYDAGMLIAGGPNVYNHELKLPVTFPPSRIANHFGISLALSGNHLIAGAPGRVSENGGTALVWVHNIFYDTWSLQQELTPSLGNDNAHFGDAVDIDGFWAVVGAPYDDGAVTGGGAAYIFQLSGTTWTQRAILLPSVVGASSFDSFGGAVAISDLGFVVWVAVGAVGRGSSGAVFLYEVTLIPSLVVHPRGQLSPSSLAADALFGHAVAMSGNRLAVGAPAAKADLAGASARAVLETGAIYAYERSGSAWIELGSGTASDAGDFDEFGYDVDIDGDSIVVGAPSHGPGSPSDPGAAYVFDWADIATRLFADDFELGNLGRWSAIEPPP